MLKMPARAKPPAINDWHQRGAIVFDEQLPSSCFAERHLYDRFWWYEHDGNRPLEDNQHFWERKVIKVEPAMAVIPEDMRVDSLAKRNVTKIVQRWSRDGGAMQPTLYIPGVIGQFHVQAAAQLGMKTIEVYEELSFRRVRALDLDDVLCNADIMSVAADNDVEGMQEMMRLRFEDPRRLNQPRFDALRYRVAQAFFECAAHGSVECVEVMLQHFGRIVSHPQLHDWAGEAYAESCVVRHVIAAEDSSRALELLMTLGSSDLVKQEFEALQGKSVASRNRFKNDHPDVAAWWAARSARVAVDAVDVADSQLRPL